MRPYQAVFSRGALEFLLRAEDDELTEVEIWMRRIERLPHTISDYHEYDDSRRQLNVEVLTHTAITYWADDAACEVRVCRIERLNDKRIRYR